MPPTVAMRIMTARRLGFERCQTARNSLRAKQPRATSRRLLTTHSSRPALSSTETTAMSIPMVMCPWAFNLQMGAVTAAGVGDGGGAGAVCSVFCGLLVLFIAPLASSESFPPSRWTVGQRLRARHPPVFFLVEKSWFGTGPAKKSTYLPGPEDAAPQIRRRSAGVPPAFRTRSAPVPHRCRTGTAPVPHRCRTGAAAVSQRIRTGTCKQPGRRKKVGCFPPVFFGHACTFRVFRGLTADATCV